MADLTISQEVTIPMHELKFATSRSGGPGGQNVNKLETRIELRFDISGSRSLSPNEKAVLLEKLRSRLDSQGVLRIVAQESRSQWQNRQIAIEKFVDVMRKALKPRKKRKPTNPTKSAREKRLKAKRIRSERKKARRLTEE